MSEPHRLLKEIEAFCKRSKIKPSTLGRKAVNDGKLAQRLSAGKDVQTETVAKVRKFMANYRPPSPNRARAA